VLENPIQTTPVTPPLKEGSVHWPATLLLAFSLLSFLIMVLTTIILIFRGVIALFQNVDYQTSASMFTLALETTLIALVLAVIAYFSIRRILDKAEPDILSIWKPGLFAGLVIIWGLSLLIGQWATTNSGIGWWVMPPVTILAVGIPVWAFASLATRGIRLGPRWSVWGIFGLGMSLGPFLIILAEFGLFVIIVLVTFILIAANPGLVEQLKQMIMRLQYAPNDQTILHILEPVIYHPLTIMGELTFVSVLVPLIEESLKPIGVWLFAKKIATPAQGFALGALSGAAYALVESLGASAQPGIGWGMILITRVGTGAVHILNSGLMGWALVSAWKERRYLLRLVGIYLAVVLIHGTWNAFALGFGFSNLTDFLPTNAFNLQQIGLVSSYGLGGLSLIVTFILIWANWRLRTAGQISEPTPKIPEETV